MASFRVRADARPGMTADEFAGSDQISGFQAIGISRYLLPSFSTWPIEGKVEMEADHPSIDSSSQICAVATRYRRKISAFVRIDQKLFAGGALAVDGDI
jgi:hypothetical protein